MKKKIPPILLTDLTRPIQTAFVLWVLTILLLAAGYQIIIAMGFWGQYFSLANLIALSIGILMGLIVKDQLMLTTIFFVLPLAFLLIPPMFGGGDFEGFESLVIARGSVNIIVVILGSYLGKCIRTRRFSKKGGV